MKRNSIQKLALVLAVAGLTLCGADLRAQSATSAAPPFAGTAADVLKLAQAKVGDDTILAFIGNSKGGGALNADQIIYLKQQGVSTAVINAMLNQPKAETTIPTPQPAATTTTTVAAQPAAAVVQTVPAATYYYYYDPYYYYPAYYGWGYPAVGFTIGWGGGHGGWHGGGHR